MGRKFGGGPPEGLYRTLDTVTVVFGPTITTVKFVPHPAHAVVLLSFSFHTIRIRLVWFASSRTSAESMIGPDVSIAVVTVEVLLMTVLTPLETTTR